MENKKQIGVIIHGRFHYFEVASELNYRHQLSFLISTFPFYYARKWGFTKKKYFGCSILELIKRIIHFFIGRGTKLDWINKDLFGIYVNFLLTHFIPDAPNNNHYVLIFAGNSSSKFFRETLVRKGYKIILEDGSIHPIERNNAVNKLIQLNASKQKVIPAGRIQDIQDEYQDTRFLQIPSDYVFQSIEKYVNFADKTVVINPFGINSSVFSFEDVSRRLFYQDCDIRIKEKDLLVCYCGTISFQKGVQTLIEVARRLINYDIKFVLIGPVLDEFTKLKTLAPENVLFTGQQPQSRLKKYFSSADIFVMPSIQDGLATVQVQALACGLPLIVSSQSGGAILKEYIKDKDRIDEYDAGDSLQLEKILLTKLKKNYKISRKMRIRQSKAHNLNWSDYVDRLLEKFD